MSILEMQEDILLWTWQMRLIQRNLLPKQRRQKIVKIPNAKRSLISKTSDTIAVKAINFTARSALSQSLFMRTGIVKRLRGQYADHWRSKLKYKVMRMIS
jgi:hypothetical protein